MGGGDFQKALGKGRVCVGDARAAYLGPGLALDPHRNAAVTVAIALERPFALRLLEPDAGARWRQRRVAVIASGTLHHLRAAGPMAFVYLDPLSDDHAWLAAQDLNAARRRVLAALLRHPRPSVDALCEALGIPRRVLGDARIAKVARELSSRPQDFRTIADAAERVGLSPSRFRALFRQHVGLPFRRYRLWRRMACVAVALRAGATLTEAALAAGFSSSAHLSTAFLQMFGLCPSKLVALELEISSERSSLVSRAGRGLPGPAWSA